MAALNELEVRVGADITGLQKGMNDAQKSLAATAIAASKLDSKLGTDLKKGSNQAGQALVNLGRVAQDAPFGFIGIQNNLNPLLESFQRLKAETGSAGGALKALAGSLAGPAGIGLALSLVSSLFVVFGDKLFASSKAVEKLKEASEAINKELGQEYAAVSKNVALLKSELATREQKLKALKDLQETNGGYFKGLTIEDNLITKLNVAYNAYKDNIINLAQAKAAQSKLDEAFAKIIDLEIKQKQLQSSENSKLSQSELERIRNVKGGLRVIADQNRVTRELAVVNGELKTAYAGIAPVIEFINGLGAKGKPDREKEIKDLKTKKDLVKEITDELARSLRTSDNQEAIGVISPKERDIEQVKAYQNALKSLFDLGVNPDSQLAKGIALRFNIVQSRVNFDKALDEVVKTQKMPGRFQNGLAAKIEFPIEPSLKLRKDVYFKEIEAFGKESETIIKNTIQSAFGGFGETLGNLISGKANIGEGFKSLFGVIADGMKQLGEAMIGLGTAKIALEKFKFAPGVGTVIAGVGVIALSSILKNAIPKFAEGTSNFGGGMALVGERGPELVRLPSGSDVIPNHALNQFGGGNGNQFPEFAIRGSDIWVSWKREGAKRGRNG